MINISLVLSLFSIVFSLISIFCVFCILSYIDTLKLYCDSE